MSSFNNSIDPSRWSVTDSDEEDLQEMFDASMSITGDSSYSGRRLQTFRTNREERNERRSRNRSNRNSSRSADSVFNHMSVGDFSAQSRSSTTESSDNSGRIDEQELQEILNESLIITGDSSYSGRRLQTFKAKRENSRSSLRRMESADFAGGRESIEQHEGEGEREHVDRLISFRNSRRGSRRSLRVMERSERGLGRQTGARSA